MGEPHQVAVMWGRIDHQKIIAVLRGTNRLVEVGEFGSFAFVNPNTLSPRYAEMDRQLEIPIGSPSPGTAVLDIMGEAFLAAVQIDGGNALTGFQQRDGDMHRNRGFA
jgi:hypothetical protein